MGFKRHSVGRQNAAFADPIEQFSVHVDFQLPYAFADRGLGDMQFIGRE